MARRNVKRLCLIAISGTLLAGCDGLARIAKGVADSAPPARPPEIVATTNLYSWNGATDYFLVTPASPFEIHVSRGFSNRLIIMEDGVPVPEFDGNDPNNGARTVQIITDLSHDTNAKVTQSKVKIFPPQAGYGEGRAVQLSLVEESINPAYTGQQARDVKPFSVMVPVPPPGVTDYMRRCYRSGVPLPPDWAETGTPWVLQGNLKTGSNLLQPGENAFVWTYSDPVFRGACIALPRGGSGARAGLAGIICQSAVTGRACFWDNRKRDDNDPMKQMPAISWAGQRLTISELKDASNLTEPDSGVCTACHRGNNVFLISPDDPTWAKVLRGSVVTGTFTTRIETSSDMRAGHPRYIPITSATGPGRPGWDNPLPGAAGCAGACHESHALGFGGTPAMPPGCAGGGVANCYR